MSTHAILDSSPIALPPVLDNNINRPRQLKRSASTASLPTPPRTLDNKKRKSRSRSSYDDDSSTESESGYIQSEDSDSEQGRGGRDGHGQRKKRRGLVVGNGNEDDDDDAFWTGRGARDSDNNDDDDDEDAPAPLLQYRVKAPVSPPPSLRQTTTTTTTTTAEPPVTPESTTSSSRLTRGRRQAALQRDSPENPFLDDSPPSAVGTPAPRTPTQHEEKPLVTYVFRGMKAQFANPLYNLPPSAHEHSLLPVEHPDFEPNEACPPKLLFPSAHHRRRSSTDEEIERSDRAPDAVFGGAREVAGRRAHGPVRPTNRR